MALRVLAVAQAAEAGGAELALLRLLPALESEGVEVALAVPGDGPVAAAAHGRGVEVHKLAVGPLRMGGWPRAVLAWPGAHRLVRHLGPDVVWLNGIVPQRLVPALGGVPALLQLHDLPQRPPRAWRQRWFWRRVPAVVCGSAAVARAAATAGAPAARVHIVHAPVEVAAPAPRPDWADGRPVIGFVGRIEPAKGVLDLLAAMRTLMERRPEVRVVIVSGAAVAPDADYERRVRTEVEALGDSVLVLGPVPEASALMPWFDVLCVPSHVEAFGMVAVEALAAGTPAVVTDSGGMPEYVVPGRNGDVVPPREPRRLAEALERVLARAPDMAEAARADAARFAPARAAAEMGALLRQTASP